MNQLIPAPLELEIVLNAGIEDVWAAWTTEEGIRSFFAPECRIEARVGGAYEIYFLPNEREGHRGAEGTRVLSFEPMKFLSFTWNNPPSIPKIRWQYTTVSLYFETLNEKQTRLKFIHHGWGPGEDWQKARDYFYRAWNQAVIPRLVKMLETGPVVWK
jgi:uncharacterized protein YndB with AHSA1/START domain